MKEGGEPGTFCHVSDVTGAVVRTSRRARVEALPSAVRETI